MSRTKRQVCIILSYIVALVSMLGSLYMSEIKHFIPCFLCWVQRAFMYPQVLILLIAIFVKEEIKTRLLKLSIIMSILGGVVSIYHIYVENTNIGSVCKVGIPCNYKYINILGFISIPVMCLLGFILIIIGLVIAIRDKNVKGCKYG